MNIQQWIERSHARGCYALITGASSGIGYEYLKALAAQGCKCIAASNNREELSLAARKVREEFQVEVVELVADLTSDSGIESLFSACQPYDIAILVNNAGFGVKGEFGSHTPKVYQELVLLNALVPTLITRHFLPEMLQRGRGFIVHAASINAITPIG